ncbi:double zinc ribbon domain-containing protein [Sphingomonas antarctica]|uniref:double zinc ribbon domain-containing protein n=1 Tax=Sphingomonas antarctica TaxID=2040274 RepID=UPI0039EA5286
MGSVRSFGDWALALVLPPRCPGCGAIVEDDTRFCGDCWEKLDFLDNLGCAACNLPLPGGEEVCARCLAAPPRHGRVYAAVAYGEVARKVVLRLKYGRRPGVARIIAASMARDVPLESDALLVPVPLHHWRLWSRGYNQALEIARHVARARGVAVADDALRRIRATPPMKGIGAAARTRAMRGVFRASQRFDGRHVVLVDDVYTSGATVEACARVARRAGAAQVSVLCWARVLRDD